MSALESKIDDLYRGPLSEFVSARNALAKSLSGDDAKAVRALAKPTVVPWAVNQVYWHARAAYERVMKSGEKVRKAQIAALEGRSAEVRAASEAHRRAIAEAVGEAQRLSAGSAPHPDALSRTFEALSLASEAPESPGRLTQPLQPAGFEALVGIKPQPGAVFAFPPRREEASPTSSSAKPEKPERKEKEDGRQKRADEQRAAREREKAAAAARAHQAAVKQAEAKLARAEAAEQQARAVWDKAHDALLEARRALATVKASG